MNRTPPPPPRHPMRRHARVLAAALVGTTVEFYDFYIFGTATALVFGALFFPTSAPAVQAIASFAVFGIAFVARPLGAVWFGHFGDRIGRKATLVASLLLMGGSTLGIALLPTYAVCAPWGAGWVAPTLLVLLRYGQGFALGGEWGGAALLAVENAPPGWQARFGAAPQLGAPLGFIIANGLFLVIGVVLTPAQFAQWGWRIPFLLSAGLVGIGLWVRLRIAETPAFAEALRQAPPVPAPLLRLLGRHGGAVAAGAGGVVACFAIFYLATTYALAQGTGPLHYPRAQFLVIQLGASLFLALGIVAAAVWADRRGPARVLAAGAVLCVLLGLAFGPALVAGAPLRVLALLAAALFIMGLAYGPLSAWLAALFPVSVRYSGMSVAFSVGGIVGGAMTPIAAQTLASAGHSVAVGLLLSAAGAVTLAGVWGSVRGRLAFSPDRAEPG